MNAPTYSPDSLVRIETAALLFDTPTTTLQRWAKTGKLPGAVKMGRSWRLRYGDLLALLQEAESTSR